MESSQQRPAPPPPEPEHERVTPTHPGSRASRASGVAPGRSGTPGSRYTAPGRSYRCTAARTAPRRTRRNLKETRVRAHQPQSPRTWGWRRCAWVWDGPPALRSAPEPSRVVGDVWGGGAITPGVTGGRRMPCSLPLLWKAKVLWMAGPCSGTRGPVRAFPPATVKTGNSFQMNTKQQTALLRGEGTIA